MRFIEGVGDRAYNLSDVLLELEKHRAKPPYTGLADYQYTRWARNRGFLVDGPKVTGLDIDPGDYILAQHLPALIEHRGAQVEPHELEAILLDNEQWNYTLFGGVQATMDEMVATTPHGATLKELMNYLGATTEQTFDARKALDLLVDAVRLYKDKPS